PKLAQLLKDEGYPTPEDLDRKVEGILKGPDLAQYLRVKAAYDKSSALDSTIFSIASYISVGTGVFVTGLFLLGFITGGTAWAVLGVVGGALAALAVVALLLAAFEGAKEREDLQKAIHQLLPNRLEARRALMMMRAISNWVTYIRNFLNSGPVKRDPSLAKEIWEGDLKADFEKASESAVTAWLRNHDRERGAWTNEDGNWGVSSTTSFRSVAHATTASSFNRVERKLDLRDETIASGTLPTVTIEQVEGARPSEEFAKPVSMSIVNVADEVCIGEDQTGEQWALDIGSITKKTQSEAIGLFNASFKIRNIRNGICYGMFSVVDFTPGS
ncbi:hypothetical protein FRC12_023360, partial [Ceratobasidium sp. 428]